jgi:hypothetical protein
VIRRWDERRGISRSECCAWGEGWRCGSRTLKRKERCWSSRNFGAPCTTRAVDLGSDASNFAHYQIQHIRIGRSVCFLLSLLCIVVPVRFNATAFMWRSNVIRLRKCSSAAAWRNTRWYSEQTSLPITNNEFEAALQKTGWGKWHMGSRRRTLGMAISGGVDSMALAALYAELMAARKYPNLAHAFIVDHKVRQGSTEEAEWVAEQCRTKCREPR